jgi:RNA polymerase sigma-70 factor (ECF subfamily)
MNPSLTGHPPMPMSPAHALAVLPLAGEDPSYAPLEFGAVYDACFAFVWRSVRRLGVADAAVDDVVQEIFLVVHRRLSDFEARSSLKTWIFGIALRVVRDHRRTQKRKRLDAAARADGTDLDGIADTKEASPHEAAARSQALRLLHDLLEELEDDKREVFVLAELEQMSAPQIADAIGQNVNTVYSRLRAARIAFEQGVLRMRAREARIEWRVR